VALKEAYGKMVEKPRFKLNIKTMLFISIPIVAILALMLVLFVLKPSGETGENLVIVGINPFENSYLISLHNLGETEVRITRILFDGVESKYKVIYGESPIQPEKSFDILIEKNCDTDTHTIEIESEGGSVSKTFKLDSCKP
jgi:hypothetical protein